MSRKYLSATLIAAVLFALISAPSARAASDNDQRTKLTEKIKIGVARIGTGRDSRIEVRLRDNAKIAGYVSEAGSESFVITDPKTNTETRLEYGDVTQVKGHNLSTGAKIGIGIAIGAGIVLGILAIYIHCCTG